jgi:hypothetical protein
VPRKKNRRNGGNPANLFGACRCLDSSTRQGEDAEENTDGQLHDHSIRNERRPSLVLLPIDLADIQV